MVQPSGRGSNQQTGELEPDISPHLYCKFRAERLLNLAYLAGNRSGNKVKPIPLPISPQRNVRTKTPSITKHRGKSKPRSWSRHRLCDHGRRANICKECYDSGTSKPSRICPHGRQKMHCKECPLPACWCPHKIQRSKCKQCRK